MTAFTIVASKNGRTVSTVRISPSVSVAKAQGPPDEGWEVHIKDSDGRQYQPDQFHQVLKRDRTGYNLPSVAVAS